MRTGRFRAAVAIAAAAALAAGMAGCAKSDRGDGDSKGGTMIFGAAGPPKNFDPIFNDDGESFRPIRQMFETLITTKPGTSELTPGLATKWDHNDDGTQWTFTLRKGVKFSDGTTFDAAAVCYNFERWYNMKGAPAQSQMIYYGDVFGGFAKNEGDTTGQPLYKSCEAKDSGTAILHMNKFSGAFPGAFVLTSLSMSSPAALKKYKADEVTQQGDSFSYSTYATEHPTGTGPFTLQKYDQANKTITLVRNDNYWGPKAKLKKLIFKIIPDENARKSELRAGTIDGYDLPSPADYSSLRSDGFQVKLRDPFNVLYLGINQKGNPKLKDIRVRKAIAYALNREELVKTKLPDGAKVASQFYPSSVVGYASNVEQYPYDKKKAISLLKAAGAQHLTLKFYYPTEVTRPYMPNPKELFTVMANDLQAVGIKIEPHPEPWNGGFKDDVQKFGKQDLHMLGWTGDYNDPGNFTGTFFGRAKPEFGDDSMTDMFDAINTAENNVDETAKDTAWQQVNRDLMSKWLPAIPISSSPPALVVSKDIKGLIPDPLTHEVFSTVSKG
ncbi:MAG: ABC transporter substrate-binding protein [Actinocatenispora sp.]